jgi:hypothetical protein
MNRQEIAENRKSRGFVVAPASATTWVVAISRHLIPGACFKTKTAAVDYASMLANAAGLGRAKIKVLS